MNQTHPVEHLYEALRAARALCQQDPMSFSYRLQSQALEAAAAVYERQVATGRNDCPSAGTSLTESQLDELMESVDQFLDDHTSVNEEAIGYRPKGFPELIRHHFSHLADQLREYATAHDKAGQEPDNSFENDLICFTFFQRHRLLDSQTRFALRFMYGQGCDVGMVKISSDSIDKENGAVRHHWPKREDLAGWWQGDKVFTWADFKVWYLTRQHG